MKRKKEIQELQTQTKDVAAEIAALDKEMDKAQIELEDVEED